MLKLKMFYFIMIIIIIIIMIITIITTAISGNVWSKSVLFGWGLTVLNAVTDSVKSSATSVKPVYENKAWSMEQQYRLLQGARGYR